MAEGARSTRQPRTGGSGVGGTLGGFVPRGAGSITFILIGINVVVYLAQLVTGGADHGALTRWGAMLPQAYGSAARDYKLSGVSGGAWWRVVTSGFLHANILHLLFNMYAIYLFGPMLERLLGHVRFISMYFTAIIGGSLFVYLIPESIETLTLGASGAIFGMLGCALVLLLQRKADVRPLIFLIVINAAITLFAGNISWQAHLGGFILGSCCGGIFAVPALRRVSWAQPAGLGLLWLIMVVLFIARTVQLSG